MRASIYLACPCVLALLLVASACGGDDVPAQPDATPGPDAPIDPVDPTELVFDPDRLLQVDITMDPADWDALRYQSRGIVDIFGGDCLAAPFASPFTYFPGQVSIDGEPVPDTVGVRKKGFLGSLSDTKPSIKIKFGEYIPGQMYSGMRRMTLNNARQDPSYVKQCIGYLLMDRAGLIAPRCSFARVSVNGQSLGIYAHVESIKKPFVRRHFADDAGNLYEGTLSDFRPAWRGTFEKKTNQLDPSQADIDALVAAMDTPPDQLVGALEPLIDLDGYMDFWAMEVLIGHWDGYAGNTNNFYLYNDPASGRFHFIPWGIDGILFDRPGGPQETGTFATGILARRLFSHQPTRDQYTARALELLDTVWDEDMLLLEVTRMTDLISPYLDPQRDLEFAESIAAVRQFIADRRALLTPVLEAPPPWQAPLREPFCMAQLGTAQANFSTRWNSFGQSPYQAGSGAITIDAGGTLYQPDPVGALAGPTEDDPGRARIAIMGELGNNTRVFIFMTTPMVGLAPGAVLDLDPMNAVLLYQDPNVNPDPQLIGFVGQGNLTLSQVDLTDGGIVSGTLDGLVFESLQP